MPKKLFTLIEANALLPKLRPLFEKFLDLQEKHAEDEDGYHEVYFTIANNGKDFESEKLKEKKEMVEGDEEELDALTQQIESFGCEIKGVDPPLIDFPTKMDGKDAYLCWRVDEEEIHYWHDMESGYGGRQPL